MENEKRGSLPLFPERKDEWGRIEEGWIREERCAKGKTMRKGKVKEQGIKREGRERGGEGKRGRRKSKGE